MTRIERLIEQIRNNPKAVRFEELRRLIEHMGYTQHRQKGSHVTFQHPGGKTITIEKPHGRKAYCHPKRVRKVLRLLDENN